MPKGAYSLSDIAEPTGRRGAYALDDIRDPLNDPNRRPVSAEDFLPPAQPSTGWPARLADIGVKTFKKLNPLPAAEALFDAARGTMGGDPAALQRTILRGEGLLSAQGEQFSKAGDAMRQGSYNEAAGRALAGALPLVGPAAAKAGEDIGAGNTDEGIADAAALLLPFAGSKLSGGASNALSVAGRAAETYGPRVAGAAGGAGLELPLIGRVIKGSIEGWQKVANKERAIVEAQAAAKAQAAAEFERLAKLRATTRLVKNPARVAPEDAIAGSLSDMRRPDSVELPPPPELPEGYQPRTDAPTGRLVAQKAPDATRALDEVLTELSKPAAPARITTPPPPDLPPGYTPRTSAPKPKAAPAPKARLEAAIGPKNYFLRRPETAADVGPVEASDVTDLSQLPTSWRGRVAQQVAPEDLPDVNALAAALPGQLKSMGYTVKQALDAITRDMSLAPQVRIKMISALARIR